MTEFTPETLEQIAGVRLDAPTRALAFNGLPKLSAALASPQQHATIMAEIEEVIAQRKFRVIGAGDDQATWQKGWSEVAGQLRRADTIGIETLKPQYFHRGVAMRCLGGYWMPETDYFEYYLGAALRRALMLRFFDNPSRIVELGCGTGMNLVLAAELFPLASLVGADWAPASLDILSVMAARLRRDVSGAIYNMLTGEGATRLPIDSSADVLTVHALEQLGPSAPAVIEMLVVRRPRSVLHIEPIIDFYDRTDAYDDIAARYHLERGYLQGLAPALNAHAERGAIKITGQGRVKLGNLYHEAYSYIAWRPV